MKLSFAYLEFPFWQINSKIGYMTWSDSGMFRIGILYLISTKVQSRKGAFNSIRSKNIKFSPDNNSSCGLTTSFNCITTRPWKEKLQIRVQKFWKAVNFPRKIKKNFFLWFSAELCLDLYCVTLSVEINSENHFNKVKEKLWTKLYQVFTKISCQILFLTFYRKWAQFCVEPRRVAEK